MRDCFAIYLLTPNFQLLTSRSMPCKSMPFAITKLSSHLVVDCPNQSIYSFSGGLFLSCLRRNWCLSLGSITHSALDHPLESTAYLAKSSHTGSSGKSFSVKVSYWQINRKKADVDLPRAQPNYVQLLILLITQLWRSLIGFNYSVWDSSSCSATNWLLVAFNNRKWDFSSYYTTTG